MTKPITKITPLNIRPRSSSTVWGKLSYLHFIAAMAVCLLLSLGFWQCWRAYQKQLQMNAYQQRALAAPQQLLSDKPPVFSHIKAQGHFDEQLSFLLANQFHQHQLGYHVITPFHIPTLSYTVLVDRGFIAIKKIGEIPAIQTSSLPITINGLIYYPSRNRFVSQTALDDKPIQIIQDIDFNQLKNLTGVTLAPFILRLDPQSPQGFIRDWAITTQVGVHRHLAYALQWFLLALFMVIIIYKYNATKEPAA